MRMMLEVVLDTVVSNAAVKDGSIAKFVGDAAKNLKPEAMYFFAGEGRRKALMVFDMADSSEIPPAVEPLLMGLNAQVTLTPVMNFEELQKGLAAIAE